MELSGLPSCHLERAGLGGDTPAAARTIIRAREVTPATHGERVLVNLWFRLARTLASRQVAIPPTEAPFSLRDRDSRAPVPTMTCVQRTNTAMAPGTVLSQRFRSLPWLATRARAPRKKGFNTLRSPAAHAMTRMPAQATTPAFLALAWGKRFPSFLTASLVRLTVVIQCPGQNIPPLPMGL